MAITAISIPPIISLAYRPVVYRWLSDATDLQYCIIEVILNGARVAASSVQLDLGSSDEFTVNIEDVIKNNLSFTLKTLGSNGVLTGDTGFIEGISIKVYEVTVDVDGLLVTTYDPDDANNTNWDYYFGDSDPIEFRNVYNWTESHYDYNGFLYTDYLLNSTSGKFLSEAPLVKNIESGVNEFIGLLYYDGVAAKNYKLEVLTYDISDSVLNTDYIDITEWDGSYTIIPDNTYLSIAIGTDNLINQGISLTNVAYYTIQVINDDGDVSELRRFNIVEACNAPVRVHWINKYGKQDTYTFTGNKSESLTHKASTYYKALGDYSSEKRGSTVNQNISTSNFTAFTKSIGQDTYNFIASMLVTKQAWIEEDGEYYPIVIEDGTQFIRDEENIPIQFNLSYSYANSTKGIKG